MVAVIHKSSSLRNILNYNEDKVEKGLATCLDAVGFPKDAADLNFHQKLRRFELLTELNQRTTANSVHISLNFDPAEKLNAERLKEIADAYMLGIGFAEQPYLLYEHLDSGHPHVHLLTTNIKADGKRIDMNNIGKNQSEKTRKEIEIGFGLVKAEDSKLQRTNKLKPVNAQQVCYGKTETKRAIGNVLHNVLPIYKYTSLPELNAVLRGYNIVADRGEESSRTFKHQGLVYRVLDEKGKKVGVPIKASLFFGKPTLKFLEQRFAGNVRDKDRHKPRIRNAIDLFLLQKSKTLEELVTALNKEGIDTVIRQNDEGVIYGLTYVDHRTHTVFNGSALGKAYSAKGMLERCSNIEPGEKKIRAGLSESAQIERPGGFGRRSFSRNTPDAGLQALTDVLLVSDEPQRMDWELKGRKKKKKKRHRISPE